MNLLTNLDLQFFGHIGTYDATKVTVIVGGMIITGFPDGSFVKAVKLNDNFEEEVGAQGDVAVSINGDNLGEITITVLGTSPAINYLDELANNRTMVSAWVHSTNEVKESSGGSMAMVKKPGDVDYGKSVGNREYKIRVFDYQKK